MKSDKAKANVPQAREVTRSYDLNEMPQPVVGRLRSEIGHVLEDARALEALRRCPNGEMDLDAVIEQLAAMEARLGRLKKLTRLCAGSAAFAQAS